MLFPKWGGLPEVTSKLGDSGLKPLPVVSSSVADALNKGVNDEFVEKNLVSIKDTSLLMKDTYEGIDNCLNVSIAAANSCIYEELNDGFYKKHGKTVEQAEEESNEALRKIQAFNTKEGNQPDDNITDDAAITVFPAWVQSKKDATTVFPSWVQPEDDETTWWQSDGNATADDMTAVFPAVR